MTKKEKEKAIHKAMLDVRTLVKRHGLETLRTATNRYFDAVRKIENLRTQADEAEKEVRRLLGKVKI